MVHLDLPALGLSLGRLLRRPRRGHRRGLELGPAQLRAARPVVRTRAHPDCEEPPLTDVSSEVSTSSTHEAVTTSDTEADPFPDNVGSTPDWFKTRGLLRGAGPVLPRTPTATGPATSGASPRSSTTCSGSGVDCLWLPPFFTSPLRDGGYDIADYTNILPECGTVEDFHHFLDEAHKRDIRVIIDFVMNHTSDQHPWFQASREDPDGPYGDFYVWSDTDDLLPGRADHLRRHRAVELDLGPGAPAVLLAPVLLPPAGPQLRQPAGPRGDARRDLRSGSTSASTASGSTPCRTCTSGTAPTARTCPRPTSS